MKNNKEMMEEKLLNSVNLLKALGVDPNDKGFLKTLKWFLYVFVLFMIYIDLLLILLYNWKGVDTISELTIYIAFVHVGYKLISTMLKQRHYISALRKISKFTKWGNTNGGQDKDDTVKIVLMLTKCYILCTIGVIIGYSLTPLWYAFKRFTPMATYFSKYFDNTVFYLLFYTLQEIELFVSVITLLRYDILFVSMITNIVIEIRMLKLHIKKIAADEDIQNVNRIYKLVDQHNEILRIIKQCDTIFSDVLIMQFFTSTLVLSTGLFAIADRGFPPSIYVLITFGIYFSAAMVQLLLYCTLGQYLINETQSIADAIYNIKWWIKPQPELRRACLLIIQRANKLDCLSAAGLFVVDYQSYTQVVKLGFSLFSLLQAMKSHADNI